MRARDLSGGIGKIAVASPLFVFAPLYRHWHLLWGATDAEVAAAMPGDELVSHPSFIATRAITIDAPPEEVSPWLIQIGYGRAGFYSYDLFDNAGRPSAEQILPEHQHPRIGEWVPMAANVNETTAFKLKAFEPDHFLLWEKPHSSWAWKLEPITGGRTRLITRIKDRYSWRAKPCRRAAVTDLVRIRRLSDDAQAPPRREAVRGGHPPAACASSRPPINASGTET